MADVLRVALAQLNQRVGDLEGNCARIRDAVRDAGDVDLVVTPELSISGYPPEDLIHRRSYVTACMAAVRQLAEDTKGGPAIIVGTPWRDDPEADYPYNACVVLDGGEVAGVARKVHLPNYGPFDEPRTFAAHDAPEPITCRGWKLGLQICEDMWFPHVSRMLKDKGAEVLIAPHGSPFRKGVKQERLACARGRAEETGLPMIFVNQVGGQDELVFDGGAFIADAGGIVTSSGLFEEGILRALIARGGKVIGPEPAEWVADEGLLYEAVVTGTRDYVRKSGFRDVVLGLSGGIDSALVAAIAVDALGPEHVHCVRLPSRYTSGPSMADAEACAKALGVRMDTIAIEPGVEAMTGMLSEVFEGSTPDLTEENLQSRLRGTVLMAISNKLGSMMLTTGNKSEMAVGYATLYGDMNGGFNPLKDVYKTEVFRLARWRNGAKPSWALGPDGEVIPEAIITKPPSAELREDQKDEDSLPPYDTLDAVLQGLIERDLGPEELAEEGHDIDLVRRIEGLLFRAEFKRNQSPPGAKVTTRSFGRDRRYPIINGWRG
ncbi:NAD+ synthase [Parvularcula sp. ZS-1/3]|uniref:Glutamine-dependent NAD(+) synthetase n=1 Tax=Parvularcula mediterranea TaxID=2732508 RepID=A0A7Y3RQ75_9PROT|nr:NAD+ synthase [Parvularcula mediterranea]